MISATILAERGCQVTLFEANPHLGGRAGCQKVHLNEEEWLLDHGFHAFFYQYYNLWHFLDRLDISKGLKPIGDYLIIDRTGQEYRFAEIHTTPILNILSLIRRGLPPFKDVMGNPKLSSLSWMLRYNESVIYDRFDRISFAEFCRSLDLPAKLKLVLTTLGRSFFTTVEQLSTAALLKSFHFYFLSHDKGLLYDYIDGDYQDILIDPILRHWEALPITVHTSTPVQTIKKEPLTGKITIDGSTFDELILAADGPSVASLLNQNNLLPELNASLQTFRRAKGCAVYRLWMDVRVTRPLPVYLSIERLHVADAVSFPDRITKQAKAWSEKTGGGVYELHCYSVPDGTEEELKRHMLSELHHYFPELQQANILLEHFELNRSVSALHTGSQDKRPTTETSENNIYLAGDWVRLPTPALLMEAACTSGIFAANAILAKRGLAQEKIESVPRKGLLTWKPGRSFRQP